jgi:hypothetical protein
MKIEHSAMDFHGVDEVSQVSIQTLAATETLPSSNFLFPIGYSGRRFVTCHKTWVILK